MLDLQILRLVPTAIIPSKAHTNIFADACFDLFPCEEVTLQPNERKLVSTGLSIIIPDGYWVKFHERSGNASKGIHVLGGVIDSGYTGEWKVILYNSSTEPLTLSKAIAQFSIERVIPCTIHEIQKSDFDYAAAARQRGTAGFSSTDKRN